MSAAWTVKEFDACQEHAVVNLWNRCLVRDEITLTTFRRKALLDSNFDPHGCFIAAAGDEIVGFLLGLRRRYPYYDLGLEPDKGWITVFFVHPDHRRDGIGSALLARAEQFLARCGASQVTVADYTPNYFFPGIDLDAYEPSFKFLTARGYVMAQRVYGMGTSLIDFAVPADQAEKFLRLRSAGVSVEVFEPSLTLKVLEFLRLHYPGDLFHVARNRLMEDPECDEILVALKAGEVIGFSHFLGERFGPFGIAPTYAGRGIGPMLYYATVEQMRKKGRRNLWLAWTTGRAKDFYYHVGLRVTRRHAIMRKIL